MKFSKSVGHEQPRGLPVGSSLKLFIDPPKVSLRRALMQFKTNQLPVAAILTPSRDDKTTVYTLRAHIITVYGTCVDQPLANFMQAAYHCQLKAGGK